MRRRLREIGGGVPSASSTASAAAGEAAATGSTVSSLVSTIVISLVVVAGAIAVVLWMTVGNSTQPATQDRERAGSPAETGALDPVVVHVEAGVVVPDDDREPDPPTAPTEPPVRVTPPPTLVSPPATPAPARPTRGRRAATRSRDQKAVRIPGRISFEPVPPVTWSRRLRSALGVLLVVIAVGLAFATMVAAVVVAISRALQGAVN